MADDPEMIVRRRYAFPQSERPLKPCTRSVKKGRNERLIKGNEAITARYDLGENHESAKRDFLTIPFR